MLLHHIPLRCLSAAVVALLLQASPALAQSGLTIAVIQGQDAQSSIEKSTAAPIVIELRDAAGAPVPRAEVVFKSPNDGPTATFFGASHVSKAWTDDAGRAESAVMTPNALVGPYSILVEAQHQGSSASVAVEQSNVGPPAPEKKKRRFGPKIWIPIVGAALLVIIGLATGD